MKWSVLCTDRAYITKGLFRLHTGLIKLTVRTVYLTGYVNEKVLQCNDRAYITKGLFRIHTGLIKFTVRTVHRQGM